jgi:glycosyltransferase involved in cell wall biosynthesis
LETKIKIIRVFNRFILGGPSLNVSFLTKFLSPKFQTKLIIGSKDTDEQEAVELIKRYGIEYTEVTEMKRAINLFEDLKAYKKVKQLIKENKPSIVHTHASKPGAIGRMAASSCNVPIILHTYHGHIFHSYFGLLRTTIYIKIEQFLARKSTKVIAISEQQKMELANIYKICDASKIVVIPLGLDLDSFYKDQAEKRIAFRAKYQIADDEVVIGIIGRLVSIKNHTLFVNAIAEVLKKTTNKIKVIIVGDGDERNHIITLLSKLNIAHNYYPDDKDCKTVTLTSWLTSMDEVYAGLDIVALSSLNEGTPVSLIEAQAACKPIVTTNVGGVVDVVLENKTAFITSSNEVAPFANALLQLTESKELREAMGKEGYGHVKDKFDKSRLVNDMENLYQKLLIEKGINYN